MDNISVLDDKRTFVEKIKKVIGSESIMLAYKRDDGSIGTLVTSELEDTTFMLAIIRTLYVDNILFQSTLDPVDD